MSYSLNSVSNPKKVSIHNFHHRFHRLHPVYQILKKCLFTTILTRYRTEDSVSNPKKVSIHNSGWLHRLLLYSVSNPKKVSIHNKLLLHI